MNVLFICSKNKWRSRTAETIFKNKDGINVKSAGTEASARIKLNWKMVEWADIIFVMENKHKNRLFKEFRTSINEQEVIVLDIRDNYPYMDEQLIEMLNNSFDFYFEES